MARKYKRTKVKNKQKQKQTQKQTQNVVVNINHPKATKSRESTSKMTRPKSSSMPLHHTFYVESEKRQPQTSEASKTATQPLQAPNNATEPLQEPNNATQPLGSSNAHYIPNAHLHPIIPPHSVNIEPFYRYDDAISLDTTVPEMQYTHSTENFTAPYPKHKTEYLSESTNTMHEPKLNMSTSSLMMPDDSVNEAIMTAKEKKKAEKDRLKKERDEEKQRIKKERGEERQRQLGENKDLRIAKAYIKAKDKDRETVIREGKTKLIEKGVHREMMPSLFKYIFDEDEMPTKKELEIKTKSESMEKARKAKADQNNLKNAIDDDKVSIRKTKK